VESTIDAFPESVPSIGDRSRTAIWWAVVARFLIHGLVVSTWVSRIPAVKASLGLSDGALGLALLGTAIGSLAAIPACGWLVGRAGSRSACICTSIGLCLALPLPALAINATTLFAALVIFGAMAGANDVAMNAQAVSVEKFLGSRTMSRFHAMFSVGGIVGAAIGGLIASRSVEPREHFLGAALLFLLIAVTTSPFLMEARTEGKKVATRIRLTAFPAALLVLCAIGFCMFLSEGAIADWTAVYLRQILHASPGTAAAGYAVFSAAMAVFRLLGDAITNRLGPGWTIRGGGILAAVGLATSLVAHSAGWALPGFALAGAGFSSIIPLVFAAGGRASSTGEGVGVAAVSGLGYLGFLVGPPAIGGIAEVTSLRFGLLVIVALSAMAALLVRVVERQNPKIFG
jgi:MFS family permease